MAHATTSRSRREPPRRRPSDPIALVIPNSRWKTCDGSRKSEVGKSEVGKSEVGSNGVPRRPSLPDPSGASDREGTARRNWHGQGGMAGRTVLAWSSYRQGRASSARGPPLTSSGVLAFWVRQGSVKAAMAAGAVAATRAFEGVTECVRHALPTHHLTHACARATQVPATCYGCSSSAAKACAGR